VLKLEGASVILLDNMDCPKMELAVDLRNKAGKKGVVDLEASGGVTLETVRSSPKPASSESPSAQSRTRRLRWISAWM